MPYQKQIRLLLAGQADAASTGDAVRLRSLGPLQEA